MVLEPFESASWMWLGSSVEEGAVLRGQVSWILQGQLPLLYIPARGRRQNLGWQLERGGGGFSWGAAPVLKAEAELIRGPVPTFPPISKPGSRKAAFFYVF